MLRIHSRHIIVLKILIHLIASSWLVVMLYLGINDKLGGDPVEGLLHFTGIGAFNLLLLTLCLSPLAKISRQSALMKLRRLLGLYAFTYAFCHFLIFILFELQLEWQLLISEIIERPYITVGFVALVILMLLALTSPIAIQRKMGPGWQKLHNWVYLAGVLIALHYIWSVKSDILQPLVYWAMLLFLLALRKQKFLRWRKKSKKNTKSLA